MATTWFLVLSVTVDLSPKTADVDEPEVQDGSHQTEIFVNPVLLQIESKNPTIRASFKNQGEVYGSSR